MAQPWSHITIKIDYGYFATFGSVHITCYNYGELDFEGIPRFRGVNEVISDRDHFITKASRKKIDTYVEAILAIDELELNEMMDGPSFDCTVHFKNGIIKGFGYVSAMLSPEFQKLEKDIRKTLRENHFLKKYSKELGGF